MNQQDVYTQMEQIARQPDAWDTESTVAINTYQVLIKFVRDLIATKQIRAKDCSILEVGCSEGKFSQMLREISSDVTAIDVSKTAISRAKKKVKGVKFLASSFEDLPENKAYDVIVFSEVLYYMLYRKAVVSKMKRIGRYVVTSNFIAAVPIFSLKSILWELELSQFPLLDESWEHSLSKGVLGVKRLRKLV